MLHQRKIKGNIYKGVIHNIDTNLQAAFVSYGAGKNGFCRSTRSIPNTGWPITRPAKEPKFPPSIKAGQEVLVQVVGAHRQQGRVSDHLAGRAFLVLTQQADRRSAGGK